MSLEAQARQLQSAMVSEGICAMPERYALLLGGPRDGDGMATQAPTIRTPATVDLHAPLSDGSVMTVLPRDGEYRAGNEYVMVEHNLPWCQQSHEVRTFRWEGLSQ